jgi:hypothetical protein
MRIKLDMKKKMIESEITKKKKIIKIISGDINSN